MYRLEISLCEEKYLRRIETVEFIKMRDQLVELFPTEDKDIFYVPAYRNEEKEAIAARACSYNSYKFVRSQLRIAVIITNKVPDTFVSTERSNQS